MNAIAGLVFELTNHDVTVQHVNNCGTGTPFEIRVTCSLYFHISLFWSCFWSSFLCGLLNTTNFLKDLFDLWLWQYQVIRLRVRVDLKVMSMKSHSTLLRFETYSYAWRNIVNTIKTIRHSSLEKYTSHFIRKGYESFLLCERWVGDWTKTATYWPPTLQAIAAFLSRSPGLLNRRAGGPAFAETWFSPLELEHWLQTLTSSWLTSCYTRVI